MSGFEIGMGGGWFLRLALFGSAITVVWFLVTLSRCDREPSVTDLKASFEELFVGGEIQAKEYERAQRWLDKQRTTT